MLVPHRRKDAELGEARLAADQFDEALVFIRLEAVLGDKLWCDGRFVACHGRGKCPAFLTKPALRRKGVACRAGFNAQGRQRGALLLASLPDKAAAPVVGAAPAAGAGLDAGGGTSMISIAWANSSKWRLA